MESLFREEKPNYLTTRQWVLYNLYKREYAKDNTKFLSNEDIYWELREYYTFLKPNTSWNNQKARRDITNDIQILKKATDLEIVISNANGSKIATENEAYDVLNREKISILESLKRVYYQLSKIKIDGQKKIVINHEKDIYEAFIRNEVVNGNLF